MCSPGVERELRTQIHIDACEGWDVEVKLYAPKNGSKAFKGTLVGLDGEGRVVIDCNGLRFELEKNEIAKMHTVFDF